MSIRAEPKYKIDRRLKVNLWGREKSPINNRNYKPGQHGQRGGKLSDFGVQLMEKQKLKKHYGDIRESQFRRYYIESNRVRGDTSENLIGFLESRLDALVYRSCFAPTIFSARQLVNHNHVLVNGKRVNIPSYLASAGDVISIREKSRNIPIIIESLSSHERDIPDYLSVNQSNMSSMFIRIPKLEEIPYPTQMAPHLVVEFYSR